MKLARMSTVMILSLCAFLPMIAWHIRRSATDFGLERNRRESLV